MTNSKFSGTDSCACPVWCRHLQTPRDGHVPQKSAATCAPWRACCPRVPEPSLRLAPEFRTCWPWLVSHCLSIQSAGMDKLASGLTRPLSNPDRLSRTGLGNWWETWLTSRSTERERVMGKLQNLRVLAARLRRRMSALGPRQCCRKSLIQVDQEVQHMSWYSKQVYEH